ncbi:MAG: hypothetical protein ABW061_13155 [Polyangiaceae bacterium]
MKRARPLPAFAAAFALATLAALGHSPAAHAAGPDPAAEAQRLLSQLDTPESRAVVQDPVTKAKAAQQRAQSARGAGDLQHGTELDALALTWAQVADDLRKTAASEKQLADLQKAVADLEQKAVRTQALIEQTIARRGRAEQNLKNLSATPTASASPTKPAKPPPKPAANAKPAVKP